MAEDSQREPTQQAKPTRGEPIEIPVRKGDVMGVLAKTPDPDRSDGSQRPTLPRIVLAIAVGTAAYALLSWLIEGTWDFIGGLGTVVFAFLVLYLLRRYDEQLRKPRRLPWPGRQSRDASSSTK